MSSSDTEIHAETDTSTELAHRSDACPHLDKQGKILKLMGKSHTNEILRELVLESEPQRFSDLRERLGLSPDTLSSRLSELTEVGLVVRHSYDEIPPRVEYETTPKMRELDPIYDLLSAWIERHHL